ncbi:MAG TPA: hypothetical protein VI977_03820 [archaeon]|nr:hypothetical protein [archaeon]
MKMCTAPVLLLCLAAVLLSGCISEELSEYERTRCIDLSSKSFAFVPECDSQEKCFSKVSSQLFDFDVKNFSSGVQAELFSLQNNLAQSWLYFNKAKENISEINRVCSAGGNASALAPAVNELNHNLLSAFKFSDRANQLAFAAVLSEKNSLEKGKISLAKEEPLFNDFILLNSNLNDLQSQSLESDSFAGYYLQQMSFLRQLMQRTGFAADFVNTETPADFFEKYDSQLLDSPGAERILQIPFLGETFNSFISFLNNFLKTRTASEALEKMPAFEFLQAYNNLAGTENSAVQKFSLIMKNDSMHRAELLERNSEIENSIEEKLSEISEKIDSISTSQFSSFDANFFSDLYSELGQDSKISTQKFSIQDLRNFHEKALAEFLPLQMQFSDLKQKDFLNLLPIGEKVFLLKELNAETDSLLENLAFLETESVSGLEILCSERIEKISSFLKETDLPDDLFLRAGDLKARLEFRISEFEESKAIEERLFLCKRSLEEFNDFKTALKDFEEYSLKQKLFSENCMAYLEKIFSVPVQEIDLSDFALRFRKIKSLEESEPPETMQRYCSSLKQDTLNFLNNDFEIISLKKNFSSAQELFQKLRLIDKYSENSVSDSLLENFSAQFSRLEKYFSSNGVVFENSLPVLSELKERVSSLKDSLQESLDNAIAVFASKNAVIESFQDSVPVLNNDFNARIRITLNNPFRKTGKVILKIPFSQGAFSSELPENFSFSQGYLLINLDSLSLGVSFFEFFSMQKITSEEETIVLSATAQKAVLEKRIKIISNAVVPKLKIETRLLDSSLQASDVFVSMGGVNPAFSLENNSVSFFVEKPESTKPVEIYFSVAGALQTQVSLLDSVQIDSNLSKASFGVSVKNALPLAIEKPNISFAFPLEEEKTVSFALVDSSGTEIKSKILYGKLVFELNRLSAFESKEFTLLIETQNLEDYWLAFLEKTKQAASLLSSARAKELLERLNGFSKSDFSMKSRIQELSSIAGEIEKIKFSESEKEQSLEGFLALKQKIEEEIARLEENSSLLAKLGFSAKETSAIIANASGFMQQADFFADAGDFGNAMKQLFKANSELQKQDFSNAGKKILEQKTKFLAEIQMFWRQLDSLDEAKNFSKEHDELLSLDAEMENSLASGDLNKTSVLLFSLEEKKNSFVSNAKALLEEKTKSISERISAFSKALSRDIPAKISSLLSMLGSVPEETLFKLNYVAPISKERLQKLELQADSLKTAKLEEEFSGFNSLVSKQNFADAIAKFSVFSDELDKKEIAANAISKELDSALSAMKEDAIAAVNSSSSELDKSRFNPEAMDLLEKAKSSLQKEQFLKTIAFSNAATAMLSMPAPAADIPVFFLPIVAAVALVFAVRFKKKQAREKKDEFRRILRRSQE